MGNISSKWQSQHKRANVENPHLENPLCLSTWNQAAQDWSYFIQCCVDQKPLSHQKYNNMFPAGLSRCLDHKWWQTRWKSGAHSELALHSMFLDQALNLESQQCDLWEGTCITPMIDEKDDSGDCEDLGRWLSLWSSGFTFLIEMILRNYDLCSWLLLDDFSPIPNAWPCPQTGRGTQLPQANPSCRSPQALELTMSRQCQTEAIVTFSSRKEVESEIVQ